MLNHLKHELHNVFSGKSQIRFGTIIQSIANYLNYGTQTGAIIKDEKHFKKQETKSLENYISEKNLWISIDLTQYISEGAEQKVYLKDTENVLKLNDSIYYNFLTDKSFIAEDYYDADHLNEIGAKKLTLKIDSIINEIESTNAQQAFGKKADSVLK